MIKIIKAIIGAIKRKKPSSEIFSSGEFAWEDFCIKLDMDPEAIEYSLIKRTFVSGFSSGRLSGIKEAAKAMKVKIV